MKKQIELSEVEHKEAEKAYLESETANFNEEMAHIHEHLKRSYITKYQNKKKGGKAAS